MPPTTNAAITLGTLTFWAAAGLAVTGCVSVSPADPPRSGPATRTNAPSPVVVRPHIVRQPAVESLDRAPGPAPSSSARPAAPPRPDRPAPPATGARTVPDDRPRRVPPRRPPALRVTPDAVPDVCGLAETYGGWPPDSPQARICRDAARR